MVSSYAESQVTVESSRPDGQRRNLVMSRIYHDPLRRQTIEFHPRSELLVAENAIRLYERKASILLDDSLLMLRPQTNRPAKDQSL